MEQDTTHFSANFLWIAFLSFNSQQIRMANVQQMHINWIKLNELGKVNDDLFAVHTIQILFIMPQTLKGTSDQKKFNLTEYCH